MIYSLGILLSAFLLFMIQPLAAKVLLPVYGGAPAVWIVCMLFFQSLLLIAYGYAWFLSRIQGKRRWIIVHLLVVVLSFGFIPLHVSNNPYLSAPEFGILWSLCSLGLPLLVVGCSAPLVQMAYSRSNQAGSKDPYFLYSASNIGSLLALLSYPFVFERFTKTSQQFSIWTAVYLLYLLSLLVILFIAAKKGSIQPLEKAEKLAWKSKLYWLFLSFVPCSLMLGVTFYITADVAATPLFWVLPLALYLLSFVITFARKPLIPHSFVQRNSLFFMIFPLIGFIYGASSLKVSQLLLFHLANFFILALLCHGELANRRPKANQLTSFYFCLALGGVAAGLLNGLLAPYLFSAAYEYPLLLTLAMFCLPIKPQKPVWIISLAVLLLLTSAYFMPADWLIRKYHLLELAALMLALIWPRSKGSLALTIGMLFAYLLLPIFNPKPILATARNFYGIKQVVEYPGLHVLMSQSTLHGFQILNSNKQELSQSSYYAPILPVVNWLQSKDSQINALVLGLGAGTLACQYRKEDKLSFIDIDQQVIDIAKNPALFSFLSECKPDAQIIHGDGRIALQLFPPKSQQLLVMDAFSSDAIPMHLLTLEAFKSYVGRMTEEGAILVHISNRHVNMLPVITGVGRALDLIVLDKQNPLEGKKGQMSSHWVLLTFNQQLASFLMSRDNWKFVTRDNSILWTDDYSNIIPILNWW